MADVVVCEAVVGNVVIKFFEGLSQFIFELFRREFRRSVRGRLAGLLMRRGIARIRHVFDYERVGGSLLLGVRGTVIITHGRARRRMIGYAIEVGAETARNRVPDLITEALRGAPTSAASEGRVDSQAAEEAAAPTATAATAPGGIADR